MFSGLAGSALAAVGVTTYRGLFRVGAIVAAIAAALVWLSVKLGQAEDRGAASAEAASTAAALERLERQNEAERKAANAGVDWQYECVFRGGNCRVPFVGLLVAPD